MAETSPPEWPLHLRVASAGLRASFLAAPGLLFLALGRGGLVMLLMLLLGFAWWFLLERRDAGWRGALVRTPLAGLALGFTAPFLSEWASSALRGGPEGAYAGLGRLLERQGTELPLIAFTAALVALPLLPLACARASTGRLPPALLAGAAGTGTLGLSMGLGLAVQDRSLESLLMQFLVVGLGFVPAGLILATLAWVADQLAEHLGVAGPGPTGETDPEAGLRWPIALWLAALAGVWWSGLVGGAPSHRRGFEAAAIGALKTLCTAQTIFHDDDKDEDGVYQYAGSLYELSAKGLIDPILGEGVKQGYLFRLVTSSGQREDRWCAAADPIVKGLDGQRRFFTNHTGVIWYTTGDAFALDPVSCEPPPGLLVVGG